MLANRMRKASSGGEINFIDTGDVLYSSGNTTTIDLTGAQLESARVRFRGSSVQRSTTVSNSSGSYLSSSASASVPSVPSGYTGTGSSSFHGMQNKSDFAKNTSMSINNPSGSDNVTVYLSPGSYGVKSYSFGYSPGSSGSTSVGSGDGAHINMRSRYNKMYYTSSPTIDVGGVTTRHIGTIYNSHTDWYDLEGLLDNQKNTLQFTIGGSNRAYVQIQYTVFK